MGNSSSSTPLNNSLRRDPAKIGVESALERLGVRNAGVLPDAITKEEHTRRTKKTKAASSNNCKRKEHTSMQDHMKEIEAFVTAVQNDKNAKKQLRANILAAGPQ